MYNRKPEPGAWSLAALNLAIDVVLLAMILVVTASAMAD
jgi:hypothetical protein